MYYYCLATKQSPHSVRKYKYHKKETSTKGKAKQEQTQQRETNSSLALIRRWYNSDKQVAKRK